MSASLRIEPGLGRRRHRLQPGKYPVDKMVRVLKEMVAGATHCYIRVHFRNGSSHALEGPGALTTISNFREVTFVFLHVVYADGSTVSGRPINSPFNGFLVFDEWPGGKKSNPPHSHATISCQRGALFRDQWQPIEEGLRANAKRAAKYTSALIALATLFWAFGSGILIMVATWVGIEVPAQEQRPPITSVAVNFLFLGAASFGFHLFRLEKLLATRVYRPLVGPSVARIKESIQVALGDRRVFLQTVLATFVAPLMAGLIVLYTEKVLWK